MVSDYLFEPSKSTFCKFETFVPTDFDLDQTLEHTKIKRFEDLGSTNFPRQLVHDNQIVGAMTHLWANFEYVCLFHDWAQQFDNLK